MCFSDKQISLLKFLDRDFNMSTIDFFQGNDAENGFELLRFFSGKNVLV